MGTTDVLQSSIHQTHDQESEQLEAARSLGPASDGARQDYERIDTFLAATSKHLHAVDAVLLPSVRKRVPDGGAVVRDYVHSAKDLEVALAHVKAHEYGSVYESGFGWPGVWAEVDSALADHRRHEDDLGDRLTEALDDSDLDRLTRRLHDAELTAPSRPHPFMAHTGPLGLVTRKVMHTVDRFWDAVEGRMVPEPPPEPKKPPGRFTQYLLGDPRFDEERD